MSRSSLNDLAVERRTSIFSDFSHDSVYESQMNYFLESKDGKHVYHVAVIDYLQEWNLNKKMERFLKT
jgi:hypothetical protein